MTLAEAGEIFDYWQDCPPAHLLLQAIARLLGWSPPAAPAWPQDIAAAMPPGLALAQEGDPGLPPPLDIAALRARNRARIAEIARRNAG